MTSYVRWADIRADHVARAGGEDAVEAGKQELFAEAFGHRLAEVGGSGDGNRDGQPMWPNPFVRSASTTTAAGARQRS